MTTAVDFLREHGLTRSTPVPIPTTPPTVAALVDIAAQRHGAALALADRRARFTFVELREAVDRAADVLARCGVGPLDRVAISLPNTVDVVVSFLAVMRLGAIWVGINTHLAPPEKRFLLEDSGAALLVTTEAVASSITAADGLPTVVVEIDRPGGWWAAGDPTPRAVDAIDPFGPAAIAYTSGTTGRPKGVVHSQHNMLLPGAMLTHVEPTPLVQGVCLPLTILNLQVLGTVQPLLSGGATVPMDRIDPVGVAAWVADFGVQRMYSSPATVYDLLTRADIDPASISTLVDLGVGGAKCPDGLRERYRERFGKDFSVGYGLTEAPTGVTGGSAPPGTPPIPIGSAARPRAHVDLTIRDADGKVLGPDEEGEICIGAAGAGSFAGCYSTMLGYWNHPDATATALRDGVLHTADVGKIDADGNLWVLDRKSDLIIRGGANVYPAEVERVIEALPGIAEVAVVPRDHERLGEEVVAVVMAAHDVDPGRLDRTALVEACAGELARYKIPVEWYSVEQFPRNAMGKVVKPMLRQWLRDGHWPSGSRPPVEIR